jgi:hypothetical protein
MPYARKIDLNQTEIVSVLRQAGVLVWVMGQPVDLLTLYRGRWLPLELKSRTKRPRRDQEKQNAFLALTGCPVVTTVQGALEAVLCD